METVDSFLRFLDRSPTVYHAAKEISTKLAEKDFTPLYEGEKWELELGKGYFVVREDALVAAFRLPKKKPRSAILLACHLDSPSLKLKPHAELFSHDIGQLGTESYGSPLLHSWLDRDLCIAGRITVLKKGEQRSEIVHLDDYPAIIPSLALHLDRNINDKGLLIHKQDHLKPLFSLNAKEKHLEDLLRKHHVFDQLLSHDLFLVPIEKSAFIGTQNECIASYRLDNLSSAYACAQALTESKLSTDVLQMAIFWDHEEVGSTSAGGADSLFVNQILERVALAFKIDVEEMYCLKSRSLCISADLAHAFHPNFPEKYDLANACYMGKGVAVKFSANQKYATNSVTAAKIVQVAEKHKIPIQTFCGRSDLPSGSTVGSIMAANLGINTVDLGIGGLAMHSIREVVSAKDEISLCLLLKALCEEGL